MMKNEVAGGEGAAAQEDDQVNAYYIILTYILICYSVSWRSGS